MQRLNKTHLAITMCFLILFVLVIPLRIETDDRNNIETEQIKKQPDFEYSGSTPHATIDILSDDDFVTQAWPGAGIEGNPYLIENLNITGGSDDPCISISDTRAFFKIKNCTLIGPNNDPCIQLDNATNGEIVDCEFIDSWMAIGAFTSADINVTNNWFNNTFNGIALRGPRMIIKNNLMEGTGQSRIDLNDATNSTIFNNTLLEMANGYGIDVDDSDNVMVTNNTCDGIPIAFWCHGTSKNCVFANNSAYDCRLYGFREEADWTYILHNNITLTSKEGIFLGGDRCTIAGNFISQTSDGIYTYGLHETIENNTFYMNKRGLVVNVTVTDVSIIGNIFDSNTVNAVNNNTPAFFGSNYWSDYLGTDANSDGLGDTPYQIPGNVGAQDAHPLMTPSTPRYATSWIDVPSFQHAEKGESFHYQMNCTAPAPIEWWLTGSYSDSFSINTNGLITNASVWENYPYHWSLTVWGRNIYSYLISATFVVNQSDTIAPMWDPLPVDQIHEYNTWVNSFKYNLNATDAVQISTYWVNDTTNFEIDSTGKLESIAILELGHVYWLEVSVNDTSNNIRSASFSITVVDTIPPEIQGPQDQMFDEGVGGLLGLQWNVFDISLNSYTLLLNGSEIDSGTFEMESDTVDYEIDLSLYTVGVYNYTLIVEDRAGHIASDTVLITINPFPTGPTDTTNITQPPMPVELIVIVVIIGLVAVMAIVFVMKRKS